MTASPQLGLVGLGKMGANMAARLRQGGVIVQAYDANPEVSEHRSLADMVAALAAPRIVWVMVPAGEVTRQVIADLAAVLEPGDLVVEGGNSRWTDDTIHAATLSEAGIAFADCGVSGGIWGRENGYALMVGASQADYARLLPVLKVLAPETGGLVHAGEIGAGHFAKMVHNGIEYGAMQAYAEGFELLQRSDVVHDVAAVLDSWRQGTVIRSWLLDLLTDAVQQDPGLAGIRGIAADSGEGRWTVQAAIDHGVATPVIAAALFARFVSQQDDSAAMQAIAAMRAQFGGHAVQPREPE